MSTVHVQTDQHVAIAYRLAGVGNRIIAYLIDALIGWVYVVGSFMLAGTLLEGSGLALVVLIALPFVGYHLLSEVFLDGQSIGKRVVGIKVVSLDGTRPTLGQYLLRWVLRLVDITLFYGVVAVLAIASSRRGQRLGDLAAGTTVVKVSQPVTLEQTLHVPVEAGYAPVFPQAHRLTDADVQTIRELLALDREEGRTERNTHLLARAKTLVEEKLGTGPVEMPPARFLAQVVKDYNALEEV